MRRYRVFILEDSPERMRAIREAAFEHWDVFHAEDVATARTLFPDLHNSVDGLDLILLDHDLGGETYVPTDHPNTGSAFCRWMVYNYPHGVSCPILVHSWNKPGADTMIGLLRTVPGFALWEPYGPTLLSILAEWSRTHTTETGDQHGTV